MKRKTHSSKFPHACMAVYVFVNKLKDRLLGHIIILSNQNTTQYP